jgi:hypothetical protein
MTICNDCETVVHCTKHGCIPKTPTVDYKHELGNLLCRIHRDGGHYIAEHGWRKAIDDADAICARENALRDIQSYAGVTLWQGDWKATQHVTETSIDFEVAKGQALRNAIEKCIATLAKE